MSVVRDPKLLRGQYRLDEALVLTIESCHRAFEQLWEDLEKEMARDREVRPDPPSDKPSTR